MAATPNETFHENTQLGSPLQLSARTEPQSGPGNQSADPLAGVCRALAQIATLDSAVASTRS
jgi:hypothetical protein